MPRTGRPKKVAHTAEIPASTVLNSLAVAAILGCSDQTAMDLMREGKIVSKKAGNSWLTTGDAVVAWLGRPEEKE